MYRHRINRRIGGAAALLALALFPGLSRAQQYTFTTIASSGDNSATYPLSSFDLPTVSGKKVAFIAYGPPFGGLSFSRNVVMGDRRDPHHLTVIAKPGQDSPGGGIFGDFADPPSFGGGVLTFFGQTDGGYGIFAFDGSISALAYSLGNVGDTYWQGQLLSFFLPGNLTTAGIPFYAEFNGGRGIFLKNGGVLTKIALQGDPAPGTGNNFTGGFGRPVASKDGSAIVFQSTFTGGTGVFKYSGGSLSVIARNGDPAPGGGVFTGFNNVAISGSGDNIAFIAESDATGIGVYLWHRGTLRLVADESMPIPNVGGSFGEIRGPICVNDDTVIFTGLPFFNSRQLFVYDIHNSWPIPIVGILPYNNSPMRGQLHYPLSSFSTDDRGGIAYITKNSNDVVLATPIVDVTRLIAATRSGLTYNRKTQLYVGTLNLKDISTREVYGPLRVTLSNLPSGVTLANAEGTDNGDPYLTVDFDTLGSGGSVTLPVQFSNPQGKRISYTLKVVSY